MDRLEVGLQLGEPRERAQDGPDVRASAPPLGDAPTVRVARRAHTVMTFRISSDGSVSSIKLFPNSSNITARSPTLRTPAATACRSSANSAITLEIKARLSRAQSRTLSAEGNSAAAARSISSGLDSMDCLGIDVLYGPALRGLRVRETSYRFPRVSPCLPRAGPDSISPDRRYSDWLPPQGV